TVKRHLVGVRPDPPTTTVEQGHVHPTVVLACVAGPAFLAVPLDDVEPWCVRVAGLARADVHVVQVPSHQVTGVACRRYLPQLLAVGTAVEAGIELGVFPDPYHRHSVNVLLFDTGKNRGSGPLSLSVMEATPEIKTCETR